MRLKRNYGRRIMTENKDYIKFVDGLKTKIRQAQYKAYRAVNTELITLY